MSYFNFTLKKPGTNELLALQLQNGGISVFRTIPETRVQKIKFIKQELEKYGIKIQKSSYKLLKETRSTSGPVITAFVEMNFDDSQKASRRKRQYTCRIKF